MLSIVMFASLSSHFQPRFQFIWDFRWWYKQWSCCGKLWFESFSRETFVLETNPCLPSQCSVGKRAFVKVGCFTNGVLHCLHSLYYLSSCLRKIRAWCGVDKTIILCKYFKFLARKLRSIIGYYFVRYLGLTLWSYCCIEGKF